MFLFHRVLKSKEAGPMIDFKTIPTLVVTDDLPKKKIDKYYKPPTPELIAYLDFSVSTTGVLSGVKVWQQNLFTVLYSMCMFRVSKKIMVTIHRACFLSHKIFTPSMQRVVMILAQLFGYYCSYNYS